MTSIPAYTLGGITRPELFLDPSGNIVLTPAAQTFADTYGLKALYLGCPPGTPWPPVTGLLLTTPIDTDATANTVIEGAAANTAVHITASAHDIVGFPITYSLTGDTSAGGFKIDPNTGVVTVANPAKIDFESSPSHAYTITVQASDGIFTSSQTFTVAVGDVAPTAPTDTNAATNTVAEGAAHGTAVASPPMRPTSTAAHLPIALPATPRAAASPSMPRPESSPSRTRPRSTTKAPLDTATPSRRRPATGR